MESPFFDAVRWHDLLCTPYAQLAGLASIPPPALETHSA